MRGIFYVCAPMILLGGCTDRDTDQPGSETSERTAAAAGVGHTPLAPPIGTNDNKSKVDPDRGAVVGIVPPQGSRAVDYCRRTGNVLTVSFRNKGDAAAPGGIPVHVDFRTSQGTRRVTQIRGAIPANNQPIDMHFEIPERCADPDCFFSISWANQGPVAGTCIG